MAVIPRMMFLLGAGASLEAGVPVSGGLTNKLIEQVSGSGGWARSRTEVRALHAALGAMIAYDTANGGRVDDPIDVERLFSALQMLAVRGTLEVAPFVGNWLPSIEGVEEPARLPSSFERDIESAVSGRIYGSKDGQVDGRALARVLVGAIDERYRRRPRRDAFARLADELIQQLPRALEFRPGASDYLADCFDPAIRSTGIATLNYDLTVETAGERHGQEINRGVAMQPGLFGWDWGSGTEHRLLKLHGSVDWGYDHEPRGPYVLPSPVAVELSEADLPPRQPVLVFGQRGKLRSGGPFLAMLIEFHRMLSECDRLVVIGYSFRDEHINDVIRGWLNLRPNPHLISINPDEDALKGLVRAPWPDTVNARMFVGTLIPDLDDAPQVPILETWPLGTSDGLTQLKKRVDDEQKLTQWHRDWYWGYEAAPE